MKKYHPKNPMYFYGTNFICYPQEWELIFISDREAILTSKQGNLCLTLREFEQHWVEV